jgi:signal peptidase I
MRISDAIIGRSPRTTLLSAAVLSSTAIIMFGWMLLPLRLSGISMLPTYEDGTFNFANRAAYWIREPARGDVVAIRMAGAHAVYVKRIVGMPGERIEIVRGTVTVNGEPLVEPAVVRRAPWSMAPVTVGPDEYFVIGDNRSMTIANHDLGGHPRCCRADSRRDCGPRHGPGPGWSVDSASRWHNRRVR